MFEPERTITTRDAAREAFRATGLSYADLSIADLRNLRDAIDAEMKASALIDGYEMREAIRSVDWPNGWAALTCRAYYFDKREAVTFNPEGFIGFAGWADDTNVAPVVAGFTKWCASLTPRFRVEGEPMTSAAQQDFDSRIRSALTQ